MILKNAMLGNNFTCEEQFAEALGFVLSFETPLVFAFSFDLAGRKTEVARASAALAARLDTISKPLTTAGGLSSNGSQVLSQV